MPTINDVYRGMQNGAETINANFKVINNELDGVTSKDVPWTSGFSLESGFSTQYSSAGYEVKNGWAFVNINLIQSQAAFKAKTSVKVGTVPNLKIPADIAKFTFALPGDSSHIEAKMELRRDGSIWLTPFADMTAQTGTAYNRFYCSFSSPIV